MSIEDTKADELRLTEVFAEALADCEDNPAYFARLALATLTPTEGQSDRAEVLEEIAAERRRQIEAEGWSSSHDDLHHERGDLANAAACYAAGEQLEIQRDYQDATYSENLWPWDEAWWKPKSRREDLVRAGALIVAEIERIDRALSTPSTDRGEG